MESLKSGGAFKKVYNQQRSMADGLLVLYIKKNNLRKNRIGITISRKVGNAVVRNRIRRLIKEQYRQYENELKIGYDLVVVARMAAAKKDFYQIGESLSGLFKRQKIL